MSTPMIEHDKKTCACCRKGNGGWAGFICWLLGHKWQWKQTGPSVGWSWRYCPRCNELEAVPHNWESY